MANIAVLLDLDNIKPKLSTIETICQPYGKLVERRAFSNTPSVLTAYGSSFRQFNYRFELTPGLEPVSQEVDNLILKTARELVANPNLKVNMIAIVSNDNDYARLIKELKAKGIQTLVIGNQVGNQLRENAHHIEILKEVMRPNYLGIDLGTTNTVMALANTHMITQQWTASVLEVSIKNEQGALVRNPIIPSAVRIESKQKSEVGAHVKAQAYAFRDQTIPAWKHHMGETVEGNPFVFNLTSGKVTPEDAASRVLQFCREQLIERYREVQGVVITHPASYEADAIEATRQAAVLAGWQEEEVVLLSEPQAALYDFLHGVQKGEINTCLDLVTQPQNILVYDLGGGTLDVTLHQVQWEVNSNRFVVQDVAIGSRTRVGGDRFDELIADYIIKVSPSYSQLSTAEQQKLRYELLIYAEKFKKLWGAEYQASGDKQNFQYSFDGNFLDAKFPIRKYISARQMKEILAPVLCEDLGLECLEGMNPITAFNTTPFVDRFDTLVVPILDVLLKAKQTKGEIPPIDGILLNGGMTYFPPIRERLAQLFGQIPLLEDGNPDLAVARGASLYAAGALKSAERVNPTNIYLEVEEKGATSLRLMIAQGQKYPYQTTLNGFEIPANQSGYLVFKVWVGMGTKIGVNTSLQRLRRVPVNKLIEANLSPGSVLDLEVKYTFDERLLLTLVSPDNPSAKFELEVAHSSEPVVVTPSHNGRVTTVTQMLDLQSIIPNIARSRSGQSPQPNVRVDFNDWETLAYNLHRQNNNAAWQDRRRDLETKSATAANRLNITDQLLRWLEMPAFLSGNESLSQTKHRLAVMALGRIFPALDSGDTETQRLELKFKHWVSDRYQNSGSISQDLLAPIAEIPGKLFWSGFEKSLLQAYQRYQNQGVAESFLNSLAKCGTPSSSNLYLLREICKNNPHRGQKIKASWALGRLISPGQPEVWRAKFVDVETSARFILHQLYQVSLEPQVAVNYLGCLSQYLAWQAQGSQIDAANCKLIQQLPKSSLPVETKLVTYSHIEVLFQERLQLLPRMTNLSNLSSSELQEVQEFVLKSVQE